MDDSSSLPDVLLLGESYKGWHIKVTPIDPAYGYFYEITGPGQEPTGVMTGIPHKTLVECVETAKKAIDSKIEEKGGAGV